MNEEYKNNELNADQLGQVVGGEGETAEPKYALYSRVQFRYYYEGGDAICVGVIRQYDTLYSKVRYTVECSKYPGGPKGGGMLVVKEEDIICAY